MARCTAHTAARLTATEARPTAALSAACSLLPLRARHSQPDSWPTL